ncbi:MAG: DNA-processing protein DprA [Acidimicrobiaceae bacterium]|nr:DNA-processing protein DprA [Acidimicrobiaceae bacterium]MDE0495316.1 DNA-processing protein DprA [Acidimicrobiaceae bacterium]MXW88319.1 DNA-processing protein DprA [Acidimicrobiaceae bacterium]MYE66475.1 DNA-processing protein DprA [Acidimicrobiaceae bacterium]MYI14176.1 DNA-processing protein DprA [Acidimicrobiaceae bacterium]
MAEATAAPIGRDRGVHAAALASLPRATPRRLERLLGRRDPAKVWEKVERGEMAKWVAADDLHDVWRDHARGTDLEALRSRLESLDAWVTTPASAQHPFTITYDIDPAPVLFRRGRMPDPTAPAVAIVGTRRCTPTGRSVAMELGSGLAAAGITVVSGLALGIDGAAHRGALAADGAPVVGVVGSGLDVPYPRGNLDLWDAVADTGTLLGEAPLGAEPEGWRFPARNRLLAALADVVVVVESKRAGGSMHTVEEAIRREVTVMAVPGSVRNPAAAGTNLLLSEGCAPACSTDDVLVALGLATAGAARGAVARDRRIDLDSLDSLQQRLLELLDDGPVSLDVLVLRAAAPVPDVLVAADGLEHLGLLARDGSRVMRA